MSDLSHHVRIRMWKFFLEIRRRHFQKEWRKYFLHNHLFCAQTIGMWAIYDEEDSDPYNWKGCVLRSYHIIYSFFLSAFRFVYLLYFNIKSWVELDEWRDFASVRSSTIASCFLNKKMNNWKFLSGNLRTYFLVGENTHLLQIEGRSRSYFL